MNKYEIDNKFKYAEPENVVEALEEYLIAATKGDVDAQYKLAICYEFGWGTDIDIDKAIEWYKRAAEDNNECGFNDEDILEASEALKRLC